MDTVYKTFRAELKSVDDDGSLSMFIPVSTNSVDRDAEVIEPAAFKKTIPKFMKHPVLVASHDYRDLTNQIGEWQKIKITENGIEGKPKYYIGMGNDQADWAYKLAQKGVAAFSIGFIPTKWEDGDGVKSAKRTYQEVELLEISQVIIPSNRDAIMGMRSKSVDPVVKNLIDDIVNADIVDLTEEVTKPEETMNMYRVPVPGEEGKHGDHKIRTIDISKEKGIKALYCVDDKKNITYMFDKEKWDSMEAAREWMREHMADEHKPKGVSQQEILDEIDYLSSLIKEVGLNSDAINSLTEILEDESDKSLKEVIELEAKEMSMPDMKKMHDMMAECEKMCGECETMMVKCKEMCADCQEMMESDMAEEDMEDGKSVVKAGAVLNKKNKSNLNQIKTLAQEVLDSAGVEEEEKRVPSGDTLVDKIDINDILAEIQSTKL